MLFTVQSAFNQVPAWNWARSASGNEYDEASAVATDLSGNIYATGYYSSDSIIIGNITLKNAGISFNDIFLEKYNEGGNLTAKYDHKKKLERIKK